MTIILPYDMLQTIYDHVNAKEDLARSCLVSKNMLSIAQPLLYASLQFSILQFVDHIPIFYTSGSTRMPTGLASISYQGRLGDQTKLLLTTLRRSPLVCSSVRKVHLEGIWHPDPTEELIKDVSTMGYTVLKKLFSLLPSVEVFELSKLHEAQEVDQAVVRRQRYQEEGKLMPRFRLVLLDDAIEELEVETVEAHYEGFQLLFDTEGVTGIKVDSFLPNSKDNLTRLSIPLDENTDLSSFTELTHLTLFIRIASLPDIFSHLSAILPSLALLRFLQLASSDQPFPIPPLLDEKKLAQTLPSLLSHLSLQYRVPKIEVLSLLDNLPDSTSLKKFNCWNNEEEDKRSMDAEKAGGSLDVGSTWDLVGDFRKRGITLTYGEVWPIW
ncbi:hypothetical protein JCM5350_006722 [Sporobolomyces pararoseus]